MIAGHRLYVWYRVIFANFLRLEGKCFCRNSDIAHKAVQTDYLMNISDYL
jgi:hypothetical protein